jgi:Peptidase family M28
VLNPRIYRAALLPILFALALAGFSLTDQPGAMTTTLAPDAFDGAAAFRDLGQLAAAAPLRRPGSAGDRLVAARVAGVLRSNGFHVELRNRSGQTADGARDLQTVIGERAGFSDRRIVVLAHRDALGRGAQAELSGTAALMQLARVLGGRTLGRTLVLASTSGGSAGAAGAAQLAQELGPGQTDAVIVLGDLAGADTRRPVVVPWSGATSVAALALRRTVDAAVAGETGVRPGGDLVTVQAARLAFPLTLGEQGPFNASGSPAVLLSASGERPPPAAEPVSAERLTAFGRAALRSLTALDGGHALPGAAPYVLLERKVLPAWPVRLLALALILPVLLAAVDAFARVRRRRERVGMWLRWVAASAMPFLLAALVAIGLFRTGLLDAAPPAAVPAAAVALNGAALFGVLVVLVLGWIGLRPLVLRAAGVRGNAAGPGAATAAMLALCAAALAVWAANPYAALLLVPALHLWLFAVAPELRARRPFALLMVALGFAPPLFVAWVYAGQFGLDPLQLAWMGLLLVAGGGISLLAVLIWSIVLGCAAAVTAVVVRAPRAEAEAAPPITVRGPATYAGPGSLGGTESALHR